MSFVSNEKREALASFPLALAFLLVLLSSCSCFLCPLFSFPSRSSRRVRRARLEPFPYEMRRKARQTTLLPSRPELSPACPEHFCSGAQKQYSIGLEMTIYRRGLSTHSGRFSPPSIPKPPTRNIPFATAKPTAPRPVSLLNAHTRLDFGWRPDTKPQPTPKVATKHVAPQQKGTVLLLPPRKICDAYGDSGSQTFAPPSSSRRNASLTVIPPSVSSGAISARGARTNRRAKSSLCGIVSSGSSIACVP